MQLIRNLLRRRAHSPAAWDDILARCFTPYRHLPDSDLAGLRERIRGFLEEKAFEGCGGQEIDDEARVVIAAYACLLLLHRPGRCYPGLGTVLVYPSSFVAPVREVDHHGIVTETLEERWGESWQLGSVVLARDSLRELCAGRGGGLNVILHEFAHQIDLEDGISNGAPLRVPRSDCRDWHDVCRVEYGRMRRDGRRGRPQVLDPYGAESAAECFAVTTEIFFERPVRLRAHHPLLYTELQAVYGQDPAHWP